MPTFKAALNTPPVNNIWISIDEDIPEVSDGEHKLIVDETLLYTIVVKKVHKDVRRS